MALWKLWFKVVVIRSPTVECQCRSFQHWELHLSNQWSQCGTTHWVKRWNHVYCSLSKKLLSWLLGWNSFPASGSVASCMKWARTWMYFITEVLCQCRSELRIKNDKKNKTREIPPRWYFWLCCRNRISAPSIYLSVFPMTFHFENVRCPWDPNCSSNLLRCWVLLLQIRWENGFLPVG